VAVALQALQSIPENPHHLLTLASSAGGSQSSGGIDANKVETSDGNGPSVSMLVRSAATSLSKSTSESAASHAAPDAGKA